MQWRTRTFVRIPHSEGEWDRWFAWYPVVVPAEGSARLVWLEAVERRWSTTRYRKRRYRLPDNSEPQVQTAEEADQEAAEEAAREEADLPRS